MQWWVVVVVVVACCGAQWVERPEDVSQRLGLSATFNCSAGPGYGAVAWLKMDDVTSTATLLFYNTVPWSVDTTRISAVAMPGGGTSLTLTSLERSDDARYKCTININNSSLSHTVRLTILGMSARLLLFLFCLLGMSTSPPK